MCHRLNSLGEKKEAETVIPGSAVCIVLGAENPTFGPNTRAVEKATLFCPHANLFLNQPLERGNNSAHFGFSFACKRFTASFISALLPLFAVCAASKKETKAFWRKKNSYLIRSDTKFSPSPSSSLRNSVGFSLSASPCPLPSCRSRREQHSFSKLCSRPSILLPRSIL